MPTPVRLLLPVTILLIPCLLCGCGEDEKTPTEESGPCGITVDAPTAAEELCVLNTYRSVWRSEHTSGRVDVQLMDRGAPVYYIRDNVTDRGAVEFTTDLRGAAPGDSFQIRVTDAGDADCYDDSDYFSLYDPTDCSIAFTNPVYEGHAIRFYQGDQVSIEWTSDGASRYVDIGLYVGIDEVESLADNTPNDGQFTWDVVAHDCFPIQYNLKILDSTVHNSVASCGRQSNGFRIDFQPGDEYECFATITSPAVDEVWRRGEDRHIIFTISNFVGDEVDIILLYEGAELLKIADNYEYQATNAVPWTVATGDVDEQNAQFQIRIDDSSSTCCGTSMAPFTFIITGLVPGGK